VAWRVRTAPEPPCFWEPGCGLSRNVPCCAGIDPLPRLVLGDHFRRWRRLGLKPLDSLEVVYPAYQIHQQQARQDKLPKDPSWANPSRQRAVCSGGGGEAELCLFNRCLDGHDLSPSGPVRQAAQAESLQGAREAMPGGSFAFSAVEPIPRTVASLGSQETSIARAPVVMDEGYE